ncbi:TPA: DUF2591 family protein [Citrobacter freundii]|nr:DUF2591 family protein [Citrobacter freundii]HBN5497850.1 DUF2591 family protein [Citrobacter freundii]HBU9121851.1 DUF2591 family protein [Citrobacter freundii]
MDYSKLSDQEINQLIGKVISRDGLSIIAYNGSVVIHEYSDCGDFKGVCLGWKAFDPCNNPADAWPIIVGKKLSIINADDKWLCVPEDEPVNGVTGDAVHMIYSGDGVEHENPLRAAMIVFLMMQDSANVQDNTA